MKKQIPFFLLLLSLAIIQSCTKDRVPNPSTLNDNTQTLIYSRNFDSSLVNLPTGWSVGGGNGGWAIDSSNSSYTSTDIPSAYTGGGYTGASGKNNMSVSNPTTGSGGAYTLTSGAISTMGYTSISIIFGDRHSKHYSDNSSTVTLAYSTDGGTTWNNVSFQDSPKDSNWYLVNGGARIPLPAGAANQPGVMFQWTANVVATASGSYRIDDVQVFGSK